MKQGKKWIRELRCRQDSAGKQGHAACFDYPPGGDAGVVFTRFPKGDVLRPPAFLLPLKKTLLEQVTSVDGLMRLLMKQRNGAPLTAEEWVLLRAHLRKLAAGIPALVVFSLPGGSILLPALAWLLDRRKRRKRPSQAVAASPSSADQRRTGE